MVTEPTIVTIPELESRTLIADSDLLIIHTGIKNEPARKISLTDLLNSQALKNAVRSYSGILYKGQRLIDINSGGSYANMVFNPPLTTNKYSVFCTIKDSTNTSSCITWSTGHHKKEGFRFMFDNKFDNIEVTIQFIVISDEDMIVQ